MAIPISQLRREGAIQPPRILIYGESGTGKTSLAADFPDTIFLQAEDGNPAGIELLTWGKLNSYAEIMDQIVELQEADHDLKYVCVDSTTPLQRYINEETCRRGDDKGKSKNNIEEFGYGKGFKSYAPRVWQEFLTELYKLRTYRGMGIIIISHYTIETFDDPESASYDRYDIDVQEVARNMIVPDMDAILLLKSPVSIKTIDEGFGQKRAVAGGRDTNVVIHTVGTPAYRAKNRYGMPEKIPYKLGEGYKALAPYLPAVAPSENVNQAAE